MDTIKAAVDLVNVCIQSATLIVAGRGEIGDMMEEMSKGDFSDVHIVCMHIHWYVTFLRLQTCNLY